MPIKISGCIRRVNLILQNKKVGIIGLGQMGKGMAKNLLQKGFDVSVYDMRTELVQDLKSLGASGASSCSEVASLSDVIISIVSDDPQTEEVFCGKKGIWVGARKGSIAIISSTIDPFHCQRLAAEGEGKGITVLDAPVSGGKVGADAGTLTIIVGGGKSDYAKCYPVFKAIGKNIFHAGPIGMGEVAKLINNYCCLGNRTVLSEGIALGLKAGLELKLLIRILKVSSGGSTIVQNWARMKAHKKDYEQRKYGSGLGLLYKDIGLTLKLARDLEQCLPVAGLCSQIDISNLFNGVE